MIYFIGAGPGAADLITVRGMELLKRAELVVYAGSLVNPELLDYCPAQCEKLNSASMTLEQVINALTARPKENTVVRLHTGDPSLYGAIAEQMREFYKRGFLYDITPGVSAFAGAAASLKAEYTLPDVSQTLILTRMSGKTVVPEKEKLSSLAAHGASMALYLSAGLLKDAVKELLAGGYAPQTPAAIVYKATWPEEKIYRCTVETLAETAERNGVTKTALIVVGDFLNSPFSRSQLYDPAFGTEYREVKP